MMGDTFALDYICLDLIRNVLKHAQNEYNLFKN